MTDQSPWLAGTALTPLLGAALAWVYPRRASTLAIITAGLTAVGAAMVVADVVVHGVVRHALGGHGGEYGISLRADGLAALVLSAVAVVGLVITLYARAGRAARSPSGFYPRWLFVWAGVIAVVLSADVFNMYVALELTTLASVTLLVEAKTRAALVASLRYVLLGLCGSLAYLTGVALLYAKSGTLDATLLGQRLGDGPVESTALALMASGLALKSGLFPLHGWLPPVYASATAPADAALSALASKTAFYALLRLALEVFPSHFALGGGAVLGVLGAMAVVWGSVLALRQQRLKRLLAYSSVGQIGYLFLFFPLAGATALQGVSYLVASHACAKGAMFMAAGTIVDAVGHDRLRGFDGLAHRLPVPFFALGLGGISLAGMPPSGGFAAKWLLARAAIEQDQWWCLIAILAGGLLAATYMFRVLRSAFIEPVSGAAPLRSTGRARPWLALGLALFAFALGLFAHPLLELGGDR